MVPASTKRHFRVAIAGSGFGGLGTAIKLREDGEHDFVVLERARDVGGVWRDNTYPGCACDVESHLYSFSFARNPHWTRRFSRWSEIQAYLRSCAERFGVLPHVRFEHEVVKATWSEDAQHWVIETNHGRFTADAFVAACGALSEPSIPKLPGLERFRGKTFHSARWDHDYALAGKRVAVIGTGASAIQFVPQIQPEVAKLSLFQRTPPWVLPRFDRAISERTRAWLERSSALSWLARQRIYVTREIIGTMFFEPRLAHVLERLALRYMAHTVPDAALRAKITPSYTIGCKRVLISDDYLPSLSNPNVDVVTSAIREITEDAVVTADGVRHEVDAIIFGTGFQVQEYPFKTRVIGRHGRSLEDVWLDAGTMTAHLGTTMHGFPNFFVIQGPNTGLGHTSVIIMIEAQIAHVINALRYMKRHGYASVEPRAAAQAAFAAEVDRKMQTTVWKKGGCASWYLDARGRNSTLWPGYTFSFERRVKAFDPSEYHLVGNRANARSRRGEHVQMPMESIHA